MNEPTTEACDACRESTAGRCFRHQQTIGNMDGRFSMDGEIRWHIHGDCPHNGEIIAARAAERAAPKVDALAFLDSLRSPRNSLGKLALPKGPMEWAVEEAWVPPAVEDLDDSGDGVLIHRLGELADLIIDRLQARLAEEEER